MKAALFITGTDTNVGKTYVGCCLADTLTARGQKVGVLKPFLSGSWDDVQRLKIAAGNSEVRTLLYCRQPLAPGAVLGVKEAGKLKVERVFHQTMDVLAEERKKNDVVLVEGVGGSMVPLGGPYVVADLMVRLKIPVWVVARAGLGTLNHTLLTVESLRRRGVEIRRILLNQAIGVDLAEKMNPSLLNGLTRIPISVIPRGNTRARERKAKALIGAAFEMDFSVS